MALFLMRAIATRLKRDWEQFDRFWSGAMSIRYDQRLQKKEASIRDRHPPEISSAIIGLWQGHWIIAHAATSSLK